MLQRFLHCPNQILILLQHSVFVQFNQAFGILFLIKSLYPTFCFLFFTYNFLSIFASDKQEA